MINIVTERFENCKEYLPSINMDVHPVCTWSYLEQILKERPIPNLTLERDMSTAKWTLNEMVEGLVLFRMERSLLSLDRKAIADRYGVIGSTSIDLKKRQTILTEGVSDFMMARVLFPEFNVLGFTKLGGTALARSIVLSISDEIVVCSDNDLMGVRQTGLANALNIQNTFSSFGVKTSIYLPNEKDISLEVLSKYE